VVLDLASGDVRKLAAFPSDIAFNSISSDDRMLFLSERDQQSDLWLATLE
jgi:hypothetical protein